jgi:hypothetical protein
VLCVVAAILIDVILSEPTFPLAVDASEYLAAITTMVEQGQTLFAIDYLHSRLVALPSVKKLEDADYPDA